MMAIILAMFIYRIVLVVRNRTLDANTTSNWIKFQRYLGMIFLLACVGSLFGDGKIVIAIILVMVIYRIILVVRKPQYAGCLHYRQMGKVSTLSGDIADGPLG